MQKLRYFVLGITFIPFFIVLVSTQIRYQNPKSNIPMDEVQYGHELFTHTEYYIGPKGTALQATGNKMNCQNCHLMGGMKPFGLQLTQTSAQYPQYRKREGRVLSLPERINNCIVRPHNGKPIDLHSREMRAFTKYIEWLGLPENRIDSPVLPKLVYLDRAADPLQGQKIYEARCEQCHGKNGEGKLNDTASSYIFPPLWGKDSFQEASSMHQVTKLAAFIRANMPYGVTQDNPALSESESFDVAAFVVDDRLHPRPPSSGPIGFPVLVEKPLDFFIGPYADPFSTLQHKFGPFGPIEQYYQERASKVTLK